MSLCERLWTFVAPRLLSRKHQKLRKKLAFAILPFLNFFFIINEKQKNKQKQKQTSTYWNKGPQESLFTFSIISGIISQALCFNSPCIFLVSPGFFSFYFIVKIHCKFIPKNVLYYVIFCFLTVSHVWVPFCIKSFYITEFIEIYYWMVWFATFRTLCLFTLKIFDTGLHCQNSIQHK